MADHKDALEVAVSKLIGTAWERDQDQYMECDWYNGNNGSWSMPPVWAFLQCATHSMGSLYWSHYRLNDHVQSECTIILISQFAFLFARSDPRLCSFRRKFTFLCHWFGLWQWPQSLQKLSGNQKRNQERPEGLWRFLCWILMPRVFWYIKNLKCELLSLGICLCIVLFAVEITEVVKFTWNCSIFSPFILCVMPF